MSHYNCSWGDCDDCKLDSQDSYESYQQYPDPDPYEEFIYVNQRYIEGMIDREDFAKFLHDACSGDGLEALECLVNADQEKAKRENLLLPQHQKDL